MCLYLQWYLQQSRSLKFFHVAEGGETKEMEADSWSTAPGSDSMSHTQNIFQISFIQILKIKVKNNEKKKLCLGYYLPFLCRALAFEIQPFLKTER